MTPVQSSPIVSRCCFPLNQPIQTGIGRAPGTFGELLQGELSREMGHFLVTFPVTREAVVAFQPDPNASEIRTFPSKKQKSALLARKLLDTQGIQAGGTLAFLEQLPEGKGLASSSADMVATARAICECYGLCIDDSTLATLLGSIEPTDGVMYGECVSFFHRRCELIEQLGSLPPLIVVGIDEGSTVDTLDYNARMSARTIEEMTEYKDLLARISMAIREKDKATIGRIATRSAEMNQAHNPKAHFQLASAAAKSSDALGIVVAHSGTYIGVLLDPMKKGFIRQFSQAQLVLSQSCRPIEVFRSF